MKPSLRAEKWRFSDPPSGVSQDEAGFWGAADLAGCFRWLGSALPQELRPLQVSRGILVAEGRLEFASWTQLLSALRQGIAARGQAGLQSEAKVSLSETPSQK